MTGGPTWQTALKLLENEGVGEETVASMNRAVLLSSVASLGGCGTIFDPSPYNPKADSTVLNSGTPHYTAVGVLPFTSASDAAPKLQALSDG
jgi:hypothetical protein